MYSCDDTPKGWVAPFGYPRINACSRLPVAFRSVPRPSSPPGAKASTECPSLARDRNTSLDVPSTMHRNHPQRIVAAHRRPTLAQHTTVASEHRPVAGCRNIRSDLRRSRPETHQNLIHPDKDQNTRHASEDTRRTLGFTCDTQTPASQTPASQTRWPDIHQPGRYEPRPIRTKPHAWWRRSGSNRRPPACKAGALPAELHPLLRSIGGPGRI